MNIELAASALKKFYGYEHFRPLQAEIIQTLYERKDVVALMPTGGGKSVCFQIPALTMQGVCIVVSPLIALMKDQVEGLKANGVPAAFINSSIDHREIQLIESALLSNKLKLLYVSPEKICSAPFISMMRDLKISLIAIDEAHCISAWGHDFRPEYTQLRFMRAQFPAVPIIALTATADKLTRRDIVEQLGLRDPAIFISSFDRPNISLEVRPGQKRVEQIIDFIKQHPNQPGIIYCLSRRSTEELSERLIAKGIKADYYHAELPSYRRSQVQEQFINDRLTVVCATIAFGMGIDKSNVRWVIHYNLPKNIEGYYQEIGRSGRDGIKAEALLFYSYRDVMTLRDMLENGKGINKDVQIAKLERVMEFAEAQICRRKILLNYFSENLDQNCGNCDVCRNPPKYVDGTIIAQMALSAIARLKENAGINLVIDVLRGSGKKEIFDNGYQHIKTYGAGRDISVFDWQHYFRQLIQSGYIDIAYDDHQKLRLTPESREVLFEGKKVLVTKPQSLKEQKVAQEKVVKEKVLTPKQLATRDLKLQLTALRKELAEKEGLPPYLVYSDATLEALATQVPVHYQGLTEISGMSEFKVKQFGEPIMDLIRRFIVAHNQEGVKFVGVSNVISLQYYQQGVPIGDIAGMRNIQEETVHGHLAYLYEFGEPIDIHRFITPEEILIISEAITKVANSNASREIAEALQGRYPLYKIKWAMAHYRRHAG